MLRVRAYLCIVLHMTTALTDHLLSVKEARAILNGIASKPSDVDDTTYGVALLVARGETLTTAGQAHGLSRQAAAGRLNRSPWTAAAIQAARRGPAEAAQRELEARVHAWSTENPTAPLAEGAKKFKLSSRALTSILGKRAVLHLPTPQRTHTSRYSDENLLRDLKKWHAETGEFTSKEFSRWAKDRGTPGPQTVQKRFGSWNAAVEKIGLSPARVSRTSIGSYSEADLWAALVCVFRQDPFATSGDYLNWLARNPSAPTISTIVNRLGMPWAQLRKTANEIIAGTSSLDTDLIRDVETERDWSQPLSQHKDYVEFVRDALGDSENGRLSMSAYDSWASTHDAPCAQTIKNQLGVGWGDVVSRAGGIPSPRRTTRFSTESVESALREFLAAHPNGTSLQYEQWRSQRPSLPAHTTIINHYDSWAKARASVSAVQGAGKE